MSANVKHSNTSASHCTPAQIDTNDTYAEGRDTFLDLTSPRAYTYKQTTAAQAKSDGCTHEPGREGSGAEGSHENESRQDVQVIAESVESDTI